MWTGKLLLLLYEDYKYIGYHMSMTSAAVAQPGIVWVDQNDHKAPLVYCYSKWVECDEVKRETDLKLVSHVHPWVSSETVTKCEHFTYTPEEESEHPLFLPSSAAFQKLVSEDNVPSPRTTNSQ